MGEPGAGAEDQASRRARRIARLRDEAAHGAEVDDALLRRAIADQRAWSIGAEGERQVAEVLTRMQRYGWTALHDVRWPGRPRANIDHIAVGPGGVVVIDAKNWSGTVTVRDGVLRQNGYQRRRESDGVAEAAAAITTLLAPQHRTATRAVLCLASQEQGVESVPGVDVVGRWQLPDHLLAMPVRLTVFEVAEIASFLRNQLDRSPRPGKSRRRSGTPRPARRTPARSAQASTRAAKLVQLALTLTALLVAYFLVAHLLPSLLATSMRH